MMIEMLAAKQDFHFCATEQAIVGQDLPVVLVDNIPRHRQPHALPRTQGVDALTAIENQRPLALRNARPSSLNRLYAARSSL